MTDDKVQHISFMYGDCIPSESRIAFVERLKTADDSEYETFLNLKMKNSTTVTLLSIFLGVFGVDRFYLGDILIGIIKLFVLIVSPSILFFCFYLAGAGSATKMMIGILFYELIANIWWIVDIFLCRRRVRRKNFITLENALF